MQINFQLSIFVRVAHQLLYSIGQMIYKKIKAVLALTEHHKTNPYKFSKDYVAHPLSQWKDVVFSDEKKINIDGIDRCAHYWLHLSTEPRQFSTRQQCGKSVMVCGDISYNGVSELMLIS